MSNVDAGDSTQPLHFGASRNICHLIYRHLVPLRRHDKTEVTFPLLSNKVYQHIAFYTQQRMYKTYMNGIVFRLAN